MKIYFDLIGKYINILKYVIPSFTIITFILFFVLMVISTSKKSALKWINTTIVSAINAFFIIVLIGEFNYEGLSCGNWYGVLLYLLAVLVIVFFIIINIICNSILFIDNKKKNNTIKSLLIINCLLILITPTICILETNYVNKTYEKYYIEDQKELASKEVIKLLNDKYGNHNFKVESVTYDVIVEPDYQIVAKQYGYILEISTDSFNDNFSVSITKKLKIYEDNYEYYLKKNNDDENK